MTTENTAAATRILTKTIRIALSAWSTMCGPLTFCDCDDAATIEAENGATD